jgi:small-conductance mechanosensitive channel
VLNGITYIYSLRYKSSTALKKDNFLVGLKNTFTILSVIATFLALFGILGIDPKTLFTTLSIVAAAIAIITKDFITEMNIGVINSFSNKLEIDDYVKAGNQKGKIVDIGLQKITMLNDDDDLVYIPNTLFYNNELINYTKRDFGRMSVDFEIKIEYVENLDQLEIDLMEGLSEYASFIVPNSYAIKVEACTYQYLDLKFQYTLKDMDRDLQRNIRKRTLRQVINIIAEKARTKS